MEICRLAPEYLFQHIPASRDVWLRDKGEAEQSVEVFSYGGVSRVALYSLELADQTRGCLDHLATVCSQPTLKSWRVLLGVFAQPIAVPI